MNLQSLLSVDENLCIAASTLRPPSSHLPVCFVSLQTMLVAEAPTQQEICSLRRSRPGESKKKTLSSKSHQAVAIHYTPAELQEEEGIAHSLATPCPLSNGTGTLQP